MCLASPPSLSLTSCPKNRACTVTLCISIFFGSLCISSTDKNKTIKQYILTKLGIFFVFSLLIAVHFLWNCLFYVFFLSSKCPVFYFRSATNKIIDISRFLLFVLVTHPSSIIIITTIFSISEVK